MKETLELIVAELDCADEARQIEAALGRLTGVQAVRTAVAARRVMVTFDRDRIAADTIRTAIQRSGMTVTDARAELAPRRRSLADRLGLAFVSLVALVALVSILEERLGVVDALAGRLPLWLLMAAVLLGGLPIFANVIRGFRRGQVTSHALMTLGIVGAVAIGQYAAGAVIVFFMRLADLVEGYTTERSRQAIKELLKLAPAVARVERAGVELEIPADDVRPGDVVLVKPGERIPVDGVVLDGHAFANQAPITGESIPADKGIGAEVFAATICEGGALRIRAERVGIDTTFGQILRLVEEAEANKAPVQRFADRFTAYYIPVVVTVAVGTYLIGGQATAAVATVLVACSCAIAMATPVTVLAAVGNAARRGIVIKGGRYLEALARVDTVLMDKTGTVTVGRPEVTEVVALDGVPEAHLLTLAAALERRSEHPLAAGILRAAAKLGIELCEPADFRVFQGEGVAGAIEGVDTWCGTERLMARAEIAVPTAVQARVRELAASGQSVVLLARAGRVAALIAWPTRSDPRSRARFRACATWGSVISCYSRAIGGRSGQRSPPSSGSRYKPRSYRPPSSPSSKASSGRDA